MHEGITINPQFILRMQIEKAEVSWVDLHFELNA